MEQDRKDWDLRLYLGLDHYDAFWIKHHESFEHPLWLTIDRGFYKVPEHKVKFNKIMKHAYNDSAEYGPLGNQLFQFASTTGLSSAHGMTPCLRSGNLAQSFDIIFTECLAPTRDQQCISERGRFGKCLPFEFVMGDTQLEIYMQSYKYFDPKL